MAKRKGNTYIFSGGRGGATEQQLKALKDYVDESIAGGGAIAGKNCTIANITDITGGHRVYFKWYLDDGTEKTEYLDVMDGHQGPQGVKGDTGNTGSDGPKGDSGTITVGTVSSGDSPSVTNVGTSTDAVFNFTLPKGDKGDKGDKGEDGQNGSSFSIRARFSTEEELIAAYPHGPENPGDAYFVGTTANPDLYIWLIDEEEWHNSGPIAGVKGDKGDTGNDGFSPVASVSKSGGVATISIRDKTGQTTATVSDGTNGTNGKSAYQVAVDEGFVGTEAEWLASLVGEKGEDGADGTNGSNGVSPVANVSKTGDQIKIHIQDALGTTEETIDMSTYAKSSDVTAIQGKIPSTASSSNKLATASDVSAVADDVSAIEDVIPSGATSSNKLATASDISGITEKIPSGASSSNKLATASDITGITEKIPSNASSSNKLVTKNDIVIRHDYSVSGTVDVIADTKALVNHILTLDAGTYIGEFKRTGITFGSYRLTYLPDGDGSISVSGIVTYSISNNNDSTYQVSYVLSNGSSTPYWNIEKLVTARENNFTFATLASPTDFNTVKTPGVYTFGVSEKETYHAPSVGTFTLIVSQQNNDWVQQIAIFNGDGTSYIRISSSGNWSDWQQFTPINSILAGSTAPVMSGTIYNNLVQKAQTVIEDIVSESPGAYSSLIRRGNIVQCIARFNTEDSFTWEQSTKIGTIPQGYRPSVFQPHPTVNFQSAGATPTFVSIDTDGSIVCIPLSGDRLDLYISATWYTEDV